MRINDENILKELRKNKEKNKRINSYKVRYMKHNGVYEELLFNQGYDHSCDVYNPFFVRVYDSKGNYIHSGCGSTIENSYNGLISSLILYLEDARNKLNYQTVKLSEIQKIINPNYGDEDEWFL
jgi:hypothetical protein